MVTRLRGKVVESWEGELWVEVGGITFGIQVPTPLLSLKGEVTLYTRLLIREEQPLLFGFQSRSQLLLFNRLIKIGGVGPKVALTILSTFTPSQFQQIVATGDIKSLCRVPGIGPKSAKRILMEVGELELPVEGRGNGIINSAIEGLEKLGFERNEIVEALRGVEAESVEELIKEGLKRLSKKVGR
jgi:Holliday junction DNA helicase RuvA